MLIYIAILGGLVMIYGITRKATSSSSGLKQPADLQASLHRFMQEFEESNADVLETIRKLKQEARAESDEAKKRIGLLEEQTAQLHQQMAGLANLIQKNRTGPDQTSGSPAFALAGPYAQIVSLREDGHSLPAIAKKLGMGLGEVELALRLSREGETQ